MNPTEEQAKDGIASERVRMTKENVQHLQPREIIEDGGMLK